MAAAAEALGSPAAAGSGPARALARRTLHDARTRTIAFAYLYGLYAYVQPVGFRHAYPTVAARAAFVHSFAGNAALRLFYGYPYDPVTIGGYSAWRVGGTLAIATAVFGVLAAVRALRTEEDAGRTELVLAGLLDRTGAFAAALAAIAVQALVLWLAETVGFLAGGLSVGGSAYLALSTAAVTAVFVAVGALVAQLAPNRRIALELGSATVGVFLLLRVIADTSAGASWLRWSTPLGWAEEMRPFSDPRPLALAPALVATALLLAGAARIAARRDVGAGLLRTSDEAPARLRLLSSPTAQALRAERAALVAWLLGTGAFAFILGMVSTSISTAGISKSIERELARLGAGSIVTPTGYLAFVFIFFILAVSLFACGQIAAAREEESEERLETLLAHPVSRRRWLGGRLLLAVAGATAIAATAGVLTWAGAAAQGADVSLARMLEAGANCLPVALLFLGIGALAYALAPRASAGIAYALVTVAFLWYLVGSLLGVPRWLIELTPFRHVGFVPTQAFRAGSAAIMLGIGALAALAAIELFRRRDLIGR